MACNPKTQALIVDRDAIDPDEGIQELALFYPNGLPVSFGTMVSEIDAEVIAARGTFQTLGARLDAGGTGGGGGTSDHGGLSGLADDDHLQYAYSLTGDFVTESTVLGGIPRGVFITGDFSVSMPNTTSASMVGRAWALTNAFESTVTIDAGTSGALFNGVDQTLELRPGRQIQITLIDITGVGMLWGLGSLLPVPTGGGAIGVDDIIAGENVTITPSEDNQQITISAAGGGAGGTSDHGALTGLADDDHKQYAKSLTTTYISTNTTLSNIPVGIIVTDQSDITLPATVVASTYGRAYSITNESGYTISIYAGSSGALFQHSGSNLLQLPTSKRTEIVLVDIPGSGDAWLVTEFGPSMSSGGSIGVNDIEAGTGISIGGPVSGILPITISFNGTASDVSFTPANAAHWPTQPTTVGEALNLLGGRVNGLGG